MESPLKQRLIGAAVLVALAVVFLPMLLHGPDVKDPDAAQVPLDLPAAPDDKFETRELTLAEPQVDVPPGGVLGMQSAPPAPAPDAAAPADAPADAALPTVDTAPVTPTPAPATPAAAAATPAVIPAPASAPAPTAASPAAASPAAAAPAVAAPTPPAATAPTPSPPTPRPVPPAAVAAGNFAINVGTYTNVDNANALVSRLRAARLPVTSEPVKLNGGPAVRVRVGPYADRAAAEAARLRTDAIAGGSSKVIALDGRPLASAPAAAMPTALPKPATPAPKPATPVAATPAPKPATPVAATPAPKPASPAPTANASGFAVQLAAPAEEAAALGLRDRARAAGFTAFVQRVDTAEGVRYRVRLGPTADRAAADALRASASSKLGISGNVVSHP
jgi:DedD protein